MANQTTVSQPWSGQAPYLENVNQQAAGMYGMGMGFNPYPGPKYAGLDPMQQQGMGMIQRSATNPNSIGNMAGSTLGNIMGAQDPYAQNLMGQAQGGYLGSNPYLNQVYDTSARKSNESFTQNIMPSIKVGAQGAGMGASSRNAMAQGQAAGMQAQGLQDLAGQIYAPAYENERNRMLQAAQLGQQGYQQGIGHQLQAAQLAPSTANWGAQQLMNMGGINQGMAQQELTGMQDYWNQMQQSPWSRLSAYSQAVGGQGIAPGSQSTNYPSGGILPALGGGATGMALGGMLPTEYSWMQPYLAAGGAYAGYRG